MEEIVQILIFVGAMVITVVGQNVKAKKNPKTVSPQEVLEDMFPEIEDDQETQTMDSPTAEKPTPVFKETLVKTPTSNKSTQPTKVQATLPPKTKIHLNNREEAKRAFIYSEIFNRKY